MEMTFQSSESENFFLRKVPHGITVRSHFRAAGSLSKI